MPTATQGFQMFGGRKRRGEAAAASASSSSAADGKEEIVDKDVYIRAMHQLTGQQPEDTPKDYLVGKIDKVTLSIAGSKFKRESDVFVYICDAWCRHDRDGYFLKPKPLTTPTL